MKVTNETSDAARHDFFNGHLRFLLDEAGDMGQALRFNMVTSLAFF